MWIPVASRNTTKATNGKKARVDTPDVVSAPNRPNGPATGEQSSEN